MISANIDHITVAQTLHQDEDFIFLKVAKNDHIAFDVEEGDQFFTLMFMHSENGNTVSWTPWDEDKK